MCTASTRSRRSASVSARTPLANSSTGTSTRQRRVRTPIPFIGAHVGGADGSGPPAEASVGVWYFRSVGGPDLPAAARFNAHDPQPAIANSCTNLQKSGFCAIGTSEYAPGYHWRFSGQTSSSHWSEAKARRNVSVADQGEVKAPSSSTVSWICSPFPL